MFFAHIKTTELGKLSERRVKNISICNAMSLQQFSDSAQILSKYLAKRLISLRY